MILNEIFKIASSLSNVQRFSQTEMAKKENVLEHTGCLTFFAYTISNHLIYEGFEIDIGTVLGKAIVHDIDEAITGDIARPIKYYKKELRDLIGELENQSVANIDNKLQMRSVLFKDWSNSKKDVEGAIVSLCDVLCVLYKAESEIVVRGNREMEKYLIGSNKNGLSVFDLCIEKIQSLKNALSIETGNSEYIYSPFLLSIEHQISAMQNKILSKI